MFYYYVKKVFSLSLSLSLSFVCFAFLAKVVCILYSGGNNSALLLLALSFFSLFLQFFFEKSNMRRVLLSSSQFNSRPRLPPQSLALSKTGRTPCPLSSTARLPVTLCSTVNARSRINSSLCKKSSSIAKQTSTSPVLANRCLHFGLPRTSCYVTFSPSSSVFTFSSFSSPSEVRRHVIFASPISPEVVNFTLSFVTAIVTVSPIDDKSLQIL